MATGLLDHTRASYPMDHAGYKRRLKSLSIQALEFILTDAQAALDINPDGPKADYYAHEILYATDVLARRNHADGLPVLAD